MPIFVHSATLPLTLYVTPWLKIAGMAEAFNLPVVSHGVPEIHVHPMLATGYGFELRSGLPAARSTGTETCS